MRNLEWQDQMGLDEGRESDRDRLQRADMAIDFARVELEALENNCEDLNYLIEIVQVGLRRALEAQKAVDQIIISRSNPPGRPN